mmetsp:Transcript_117966/g.341017  ORF Transcript_117966/g.341017 Transcript_117966/m.341017 type:complete len:226 (+) Transcript_117966:820-1497(+)
MPHKCLLRGSLELGMRLLRHDPCQLEMVQAPKDRQRAHARPVPAQEGGHRVLRRRACGRRRRRRLRPRSIAVPAAERRRQRRRRRRCAGAPVPLGKGFLEGGRRWDDPGEARAPPARHALHLGGLVRLEFHGSRPFVAHLGILDGAAGPEDRQCARAPRLGAHRLGAYGRRQRAGVLCGRGEVRGRGGCTGTWRRGPGAAAVHRRQHSDLRLAPVEPRSGGRRLC